MKIGKTNRRIEWTFTPQSEDDRRKIEESGPMSQNGLPC
jgi:hypothetical protein